MWTCKRTKQQSQVRHDVIDLIACLQGPSAHHGYADAMLDAVHVGHTVPRA
jgi:hypothetical protein